MRNLILSLAILFAAAAAARAEGCFGPGTPLFHCTTKDGAKTVDLCLQGNVAYYRFAPTGGAAEIILAQPVREVSMRPWNGIGRTILEEAQFTNDAYAYRVYYAIDRIPEDGEVKVTVAGGVSVIKGDETVAQLDCDVGSVSVRDIYPLYVAKEAAGQCWSRDRFEWGPC